MYRDHMLNELREADNGKKVQLVGWINAIRNFGEIIFIDLRDKTGITQLVIEDESLRADFKKFRNEYVISIKGEVRLRKDINEVIPTGKIEVLVDEYQLINQSEVIPFEISDDAQVKEDTLLHYRYLDLRRPKMQNNLHVRHQVNRAIRNFLDNHEFVEIETPLLTKSTPEGARDFLVPSRLQAGKFYALPQSPQIYKNLLMISGFERYYQIVRAFRDEDLRSDRQPEFTQLDLEMSFMSEQEIRDLMEQMLKYIMQEVADVEIAYDFPVMDYDEAMNKYGVDNPDTRYEMLIEDVTEVFANSEFKVFAQADFVRLINCKNLASNYSRKDIQRLEEIAKKNKAKGLAWMKFENDNFTGPIAKFFTEAELNHLKEQVGVADNDLLLFGAGDYAAVCQSLGALRKTVAKEQELYSDDQYNFLWIVNWPMFEFDEETDRFHAMHHPFTMPKDQQFGDDLHQQRALAYDIVLNGSEIGGGSIRINKPELQSKMFEILNFTEAEIKADFGFLIDAYKYGAPYHGGIAFGLDRLVMLILQTESIRDVIAFPKNNRAVEVMMDSPATVKLDNLQDLHLQVVEESNE